MKQEKKDKNKVELEKEENKPRIAIAPSRKLVKRVMNFDVYFQILMRKKPGIMPHHKAPMRKYAESKGLESATEEEFDRVFRVY